VSFTNTLYANQLRVRWEPHTGHVAKCLSCGGRVERYAMNLGRCQSCGRDWYMEHNHRGGRYVLRAVP